MTPKKLQSYGELKTPKKPRAKSRERFEDKKDEGLRAYVRGLPCLLGLQLTECSGATEAAHVTSKGAAGGDWENVVPLCWTHHHEQHRTGIRSFEYRHQVRLRVWARKITSRYLDFLSGKTQ